MKKLLLKELRKTLGKVLAILCTVAVLPMGAYASQGEAESYTEYYEAADVIEQKDKSTEHSWRYEEGQWIGSYGASTFAENAFEPWTKVDDVYINSNGDTIPGAFARGIDVSGWQGVIDWEAVKKEDVSFAIIRCGYSTDGKDSYWDRNASECERLGIPYGTYLYSYAESPEEAEEEAKHVLNLVKNSCLDYPIYYDMEDDIVRYIYTEEPAVDEETGEPVIDPHTGEPVMISVKGRQRTGAELAEMAKSFVDTIESAGYDASIYTNLDWSENVLTDGYFERFTDRWIAQYHSECTYDGQYDLWQCSCTGSIDGIDGPVDINMLYTDKYIQNMDVKQFVRRMYRIVLGRAPEQGGFKYWTELLLSGERTGAEVALGFVFSDEFKNKGYNDNDYVEILYKTCMDRSSDNAGKNDWVNRLSMGVSRLYVLRGFIESAEFTNICEDFGIIRGNIPLTENRDQNEGITGFVSRCYNLFLGRSADIDGLNDWCGRILSNAAYAKQLPEGFIGSVEFVNKNVADEEYVKICYRAILDREADESGLDYWVDRLEKGQSRISICKGFTESAEFAKLLSKYGLQ